MNFQSVINLVEGVRGSQGNVTLSPSAVRAIRQRGGKIKGEVTSTGGLNVCCETLVKTVDKLRKSGETAPQKPEENEENESRTLWEDIPEDIRISLEANGMGNEDELAEYIESGEKLTELNGIGESRAKTILEVYESHKA